MNDTQKLAQIENSYPTDGAHVVAKQIRSAEISYTNGPEASLARRDAERLTRQHNETVQNVRTEIKTLLQGNSHQSIVANLVRGGASVEDAITQYEEGQKLLESLDRDFSMPD